MNTAAAGVSWSIKPTLTGELVILRPFVRDDAVAMATIVADPELIKLTASVTSSEAALASATEPDQRTYDWYGSRSDQDDRMDLGIVDNATG
ncbi:MAG: GNAT family N-acetyltransferase, partial [Nakamurella sp.]